MSANSSSCTVSKAADRAGWPSVVFLVLTLVISCGTALSVGGEISPQALTDLITPPDDPEEAERVRIWLPAERVSRCRVTIELVDDRGRVVRHLLDLPLPSGYYNFYWDKKDDSGHFVEPGTYRYCLNDCGRRNYGVVKARFKKWETRSHLYLVDGPQSATVGFELTEDSALVSISVFNRRGRLVDTPVIDSLMNKGRYVYEWAPRSGGYRGRYVLRLTVGDFTHALDIFLPRRQ